MVPFSLFVLNAELHQLADPTQYMKSFDLLYHLLGYCRNQIQLLGQQQGNTPLASPGYDYTVFLSLYNTTLLVGQDRLRYSPLEEAKRNC